MKFMYWFVGILLLCNIADGQRIVLLTVSDSDDITLGDSFLKNTHKFKAQIQEYATTLQMEVIDFHLEGKAVSFDNIQHEIEDMTVKADDVLIFHYSGHGVAHRQLTFPKLLIPSSINAANLEYIHTLLKAKNPRLLLTLGDCCNGGIGNSAGRKSSNEMIETLDTNILKELFLNEEGYYIASASQKGFSAYYDVLTGGYFTAGLLYALYESLKGNQRHVITWNSLFQQSIKNTTLIAEGWGKVQQPQFRKEERFDYYSKKETIQYQIKQGDTLSEIAKHYRVSIQELKIWNQLQGDKIYFGHYLTIKTN